MKQTYIIIFLLCFFYNTLYAQEKKTINNSPLFNGGSVDEFVRYVQKQIEYPEEALFLELEGKIFVKFLVNFENTLTKGKGKTDSIQIVKSFHPIFDTIVYNIIKSAPYWTSAKSRGKPENTWITIAVKCKMPEISEKISQNKKDYIFAHNKQIYIYTDSKRLKMFLSRHIKKSDSIEIKTTLKSGIVVGQEITLYKFYKKYNIQKTTYLNFKNTEVFKEKLHLQYEYKKLVEKQTFFSYIEKDKYNRNNEYVLTFASINPRIRIKRIYSHFQNKKTIKKASSFTKTLKSIQTIGDTIIAYNYINNLVENNWIDTYNTHTTTLKNEQLLEESFQITSGISETGLGDNKDTYEYFNDNITLCKIKRNESKKINVSFIDGKINYIYSLYDNSINFEHVFSNYYSPYSFEYYLNEKGIIYFKKIQIFDSNNRLLKEKYFAKAYKGTLQLDRLFIYNYIKNKSLLLTLSSR